MSNTWSGCAVAMSTLLLICSAGAPWLDASTHLGPESGWGGRVLHSGNEPAGGSVLAGRLLAQALLPAGISPVRSAGNVTVQGAPLGTVLCRVSVRPDGTQANGASFVGSMSTDGRYVAFVSLADNLVPGDTNECWDVFVYDRHTGQIERVSVASDGTQADYGTAYDASISADGRYVAFTSDATNLVPGITNDCSDVFVHDRLTGQTTRVSVASDGTQGNNTSYESAMSADGRYVAFTSRADNLVPADTSEQDDIFVHDRQTGQTERVSVASDGTQSNGRSQEAAISADGRYVAFESLADNLVAGDTNEASDIFVHDRQTGQTERVSLAHDGAQADRLSATAAISADGRYVAFNTNATNLVPDKGTIVTDVYVRDRLMSQTERVSVATDGTEGNFASYSAHISGDGRYVAFASSANNLVPDDTNLRTDVFLRDRQTGQTIRVSEAADGTQGEHESLGATISPDGSYVAFNSRSTTFVPGVTNDVTDVYLRGPALPPVVNIITPDSGSDDEAIDVTIGGANYHPGVTARLTRSGQPDRHGYDLQRISDTQLTCSFDLDGAQAGQWNVVVTNVDTASGQLPNGFTVQQTVPRAPSQVKLSAINDSTEMQVDWQDNSANDDGFKLERRRWLVEGKWSDWTAVTETGPNVIQFIDDTLPVGSSYQYRVRAFNDAGASAWAESTGLRCEPTPIWPVNLKAELSSDGMAVDLTWVDKSEYEDRQKIERRRQLDATTWTDWTTIVWLGANVTTYTDSNLDGEGLHQYRVRALRGPGASEYSPVAEVFVQAADPVPTAPSTVGVVAINDCTDMRITWQDNSINEQGFRLERRRWLPEGTWSAWSLLTTTGPNVTQFVDTLLPVGSSYQYRVRAFNAHGSSGWATSVGVRCEPTPIWPVDLQAENRNVGRDLMLSWTIRSEWADRQKIERRRQLGQLDVWSDWETIVWLGAHRNSYLDDSIPGDGKYQYRVRAFRGLGASEYSPVLTVWRLEQVQPAALVSSMNVQQAGGQAASVVYTLSAAAEVTLEVRNIAGRLIATVPQGTVEAGVNTATWNLRNTSGAPVPSGMYLCTLVVDGADGSRSSAVRTVNVQR